MGIESMVTTRPSAPKMGGKLFVRALLVNFCCVVLLITSIFFFLHEWLLWIMEFLFMAMMIAFVASPVNNRGHRDRGYYERNNLKPDRLYGLKAGLIAAAPFYVLTIIAVFITLGYLPDWFFFYRVCNAYIWPLITIVVRTMNVLDFPLYVYLIFALAISVIPVTAHIAYTLGLKDYVLSDHILYQKNKSN